MSETRSFDRKPRGGFRGGGGGGFRGKPYDRDQNGDGDGGDRGRGRGGRGFRGSRGGGFRGRGGGDRGGGGHRGGRFQRGFDSQNWRSALDHGLMPLPDEVEARLSKLRQTLNAQGKDPEEIKKILRNERRNAENDTKKNIKNACYRCRGFGHKLAECPQASNDSMSDVCYKCGSTEHKLFECRSSKPGLDFARCFICQEEGHIARECPQNKRGAYPRGGSCKICESVHHLAKDCPEQTKDSDEEEEQEFTLDTMGETGSADAQDFIPINKKKVPKVVKF